MPIPELAEVTGKSLPSASTAFDQAKYDQLKKYSPAAAEAYKSATTPKPAVVPQAPAQAGTPGYYSAPAARMIEQAKQSPAAAAVTAREAIAAPDASKYMKDAAPDPSEEYGGMVEPAGITEEPEAKGTGPQAVAASAKELAGASPSRVGEVIDKLKEEEAKGGPDFWDVIQAASAGWQGQVPLYVQKELAKKEQESELASSKELMGLETEQRAKERSEEQAFQRQMTREELENRLKIAGIGSVQGLGGLSLGDLGIGGR